MTQRAVVYCRVSTKEQVANFSLPVQQRACLDYCERQGIAIARVFIEEGESAKTADRPELKEMLAYCRQQRGSVHCLVVYTVDRLARNSYDHAVIRRHLAGLGITLRAASQPIDDSPTGRAMEGMLSVFAQLDNDIRAAKVKEGMQEAARRGQWVWRAPLGYVHITRAEGGRTLMLDPERAPLVRMAFELVASGLHTINGALEQVTEHGLRSVRGERMIPQTFRQILENPVYAGRIRIPVWQLDVPGNFPALVEPETWWRAQTVLSGGASTITPHHRNRPAFPLRGTVRCSKCGRPLTASWSTGRGGKYGYYHCPVPAGCKATRVRREILEADFVQLLGELRPEPEYFDLFRAVVLDTWQSRQKEVVDRRTALEAEVQENKRRQNRLVEAYVYEKAISEGIYQEQMLRLSEAQTLAQMGLHDAQVDEIDIEAVLAFAEHLAMRADRLWMAASLDQRQRLQKVLFPAGLPIRENRLVRTQPSLLLFNSWDETASVGSKWCALEDSNL
jgi:site-specific DNA recombinase